MPARRYASSPQLTFEQWLAIPVVHRLTTSESLGWNDVSIYTSRIPATEDIVHGPLSSDHFLVFQTDGRTRIRGRLQDRYFDEDMAAGAIGLIPAQHESTGLWSHSVTAAFIQLSQPLITALADSTFHGDPEHIRLLPRLNFRDPHLRYLITELYGELQNPAPLGTLFADSISHMMMIHLLRKYSNAVTTTHVPRAHLSAGQLYAIDEYIHEHLDQKITLHDLAHCIHMSVAHFERMFRAAHGCAPYQYVLERRIERAKTLLCAGRQPLHEVAHQCGFSNQSHFTRHFTIRVGVSPSRFAARLKN